MDSAIDQATIDRKRNRAQEVDTARQQIIRGMMSQRLGRLYLWDELSRMNVFQQTLQFGRDGYASTAFAEGRRSIGLRLLADITRWCPDEYLLMTRENTAMENHNVRSPEPDHSDPDAGSLPE